MTLQCTHLQKLPEINRIINTHILRFKVSAQIQFSSADLKPRRIHTVHTSVVEVIAKGQNKVSSHLLCYFTHFLSSSLLYSCDVGGIGDPAPVSYSKELNGGSVSCKAREYENTE